MQKKDEIIQLITAFQKTAIGVATNFENTTYEDYEYARNQLLSQPSLHGVIPEWIVKNRTGSQFRSSMQAISDTYKGRRSFIYDSLSELIERSQQGGNQPVSLSLNEVNSAIKNGNLDSIWKKIQSRREDDPEGAITASRTMLESTLKYILEELGEEYSDKDDLPDLYKRVSQKLNLSPDKHHEQIFKQICQGITPVVISFGTLRNKYGDAHGKGKLYVAPKKRHADLVINLSGVGA